MGAFASGAVRLGTVLHQEIESCQSGRARPISELDDIDGLVTKYQARLLRFVTYSTGDPDMAQTITQDTFLKAYNGRESFRGECSVNTWLTGIAVNVIRDHLRTERYKFWKRVKTTAVDAQEMASVLAAQGLDPEGQALAKEKVRQVAQILETLSRKQRTIFLMKFSEELSVEEICDTLGMSVNTVRTHLHRALKAVRGRMGAGA
jgi:RNA polymerase sigma-70 factor (ECF subfamily)